MPNSIYPRNSISHRLFLNWGENIPKYFSSCPRVLKAIMLSFPMSVPFVAFCAWLFYHIQQQEPVFSLFHFQKLISPNKTRPLIFLGVKNWRYSNDPTNGDPRKLWYKKKPLCLLQHRQSDTFYPITSSQNTQESVRK